jgi:hypothetical protein
MADKPKTSKSIDAFIHGEAKLMILDNSLQVTSLQVTAPLALRDFILSNYVVADRDFVASEDAYIQNRGDIKVCDPVMLLSAGVNKRYETQFVPL